MLHCQKITLVPLTIGYELTTKASTNVISNWSLFIILYVEEEI